MRTATHLTMGSPLDQIKGVGPRTASLLQNKGVFTLGDLLHHLPRDYVDQSKVTPISQCKPGDKAVLEGILTAPRWIPSRFPRRKILTATLIDDSGRISLKWFHAPTFLVEQLKPQARVRIYGEIRGFGHSLEMIHPELDFRLEKIQGIAPIYPLFEGLQQRTLSQIIKNALNSVKIQEWIPAWILKKYQLMDFHSALEQVHFPLENTNPLSYLERKSQAQKRLIFNDFFEFEWLIGRNRYTFRKDLAPQMPCSLDSPFMLSFIEKIPFSLTDHQNLALQKILGDLSVNKPMNRLLQGDVGCGKTIVALLSAAAAFKNNFQVVYMAPTEILAHQILAKAQELYDGQFFWKGLFGSTKIKDRKETLMGLALGSTHGLVATHAVLEDDVIFKRLGYCIIDEQHRFGVDQRLTLRKKGEAPHTLSMTATPIPRTLAMTYYGDLDVTSIRQKPSHRKPIVTKIVAQHQRDKMFQTISHLIEQGQQAYVVYPLVEESETLDLQNALEGQQFLQSQVFTKSQVGLIHGRMKAKDKDQVMDQFRRNEIQILVSTTVIEVGIDVPNATAMVIEHSERFGLSQLHQLRGRVGRGNLSSYCYLCTGRPINTLQEKTLSRLQALEESEDGFRIAEFDLEIRGPGEFLGTKQSGILSFKYADLCKDVEILETARQAALELILQDPELLAEGHQELKSHFLAQNRMNLERFKTS